MRHIHAWYRRHPNAVIYVLFSVLVVVGFWRVETVVRRVDHEAKLRAWELCVQGNEARRTVSDALVRSSEVLIEVSAPTRTLTPQEKASRDAAVAAYRARTQRDVVEPLAPRGCGPRP